MAVGRCVAVELSQSVSVSSGSICLNIGVPKMASDSELREGRSKTVE